MNDMRAVIVPKSDQINADDLLAGPITITITSVSIRPGTEQPVSIFFDGDNGKPFKPCKSMARVMVGCWGPDANEYIGRSMTLYCDPKVQWGGLEVGGIRISHLSHIDSLHTMALTATKGSKKPFTVKPLAKVTPPANSTPNAPTESRWFADAAKMLNAEKDGRRWFALLQRLLTDAPSRQDVVLIGDLPSMKSSLEIAPKEVQKQIKDMLADAYGRFEEPAEDTFHGDLPSREDAA